MIDPETFWLTATNVVLGVAAIACCAAIGYGITREFLDRAAGRKPVREKKEDDRMFRTRIGVTMADGGARRKEPARRSRQSGAKFGVRRTHRRRRR